MTSYFDEIPAARFYLRIFGPLLLCFAICVMGAGFMAKYPSYQDPKSTIGSDVAVWTAYQLTCERLVTQVSENSDSCLRGVAISDFERQRCTVFWSLLSDVLTIVLLPFGITLVALVLLRKSLTRLYCKVVQLIDDRKLVAVGVVTDPPEGSLQLFSWIYCVRPVVVELPNHKQMQVYLPPNGPFPKPGEKLAILEALSVFGEKRHFAVLYTPHVAVIRGI
jgi:hypothetical protein